MTLNEKLGEEACRKLTKFLGEYGWFGDCPKCGTSFEWIGATEEKQEPSPHGCFCTNCQSTVKGIIYFECECLDFSNWRVVGRLIKKFKQSVYGLPNESYWMTMLCNSLLLHDPQEAICRAVLAYLEQA